MDVLWTYVVMRMGGSDVICEANLAIADIATMSLPTMFRARKMTRVTVGPVDKKLAVSWSAWPPEFIGMTDGDLFINSSNISTIALAAKEVTKEVEAIWNPSKVVVPQEKKLTLIEGGLAKNG